MALETRSELPRDVLTANGTHRYYTDEIRQTCSMVAMLTLEREPVFAIEALYRSGFCSTIHCHELGQISFAVHGMMSITTEDRTVVVPPGHAIWIPAGCMHQALAFDDICVMSAYAEPDRWPDMPVNCQVLQVSTLFEELLKRVIAHQLRRARGPVYDALLLLLHEEFRAGRPLDLAMPMPQDKRLRRVCNALLREPRIGHRKTELARIGNMSCRTMTRLFQSELGMTYSDWVQLSLIASAVGRLAEGEPVAHVAADLGYGSPSAFSAMFRRRIGRQPSSFALRC